MKIFRYNLSSEVFSSIENGICIPWLRNQDPILNESCNDQKMMFFSIVDFSSGTLPKMASIQVLEVSVPQVASLNLIRLKQCAAIMFSNFFRKTSSSSKY